MIFLTAQSDDPYFLWQLSLQLHNFKELSIKKEEIHILFGFNPMLGLKEEATQFMLDNENFATFFLYPDDRIRRRYRSSIRPNIIKKHFEQLPELENTAVFYHDCDIIFRQLPNFAKMLEDKHWYLSDTSSYTGVTYLEQFGDNTVDRLARVIGLDPKIIYDHDADVGGAQCLLKGATVDFWQKVEEDSEALYTHMEDNRQNFSSLSPDGLVYIQSWCADMWALLWNSWRFGYSVKVVEDLDFSWPERQISNWEAMNIYHNTGIPRGSKLFDKTKFINRTPFFNFYESIPQDVSQIKYVDVLRSYEKSYHRDLMDVTFLFQIKADSSERLENIKAAIDHLTHFFSTNIQIVEVGTSQHLFVDCTESLQYEFIYEDAHFLNFSRYWNLLCDKACTPYVVLHDADIILNPEQLYQAVSKLRHGKYALCLPYDGTFVNIGPDTRSYYLKERKMSALSGKDGEGSYTLNNSVGGCVVLKKDTFMESGGSNERMVGWGLDDKERIARIKILGHKVGSVSGELYHLCHPRKSGSRYASQEVKMKGFEEYLRVCALTTKELEEYIKTW